MHEDIEYEDEIMYRQIWDNIYETCIQKCKDRHFRFDIPIEDKYFGCHREMYCRQWAKSKPSYEEMLEEYGKEYTDKFTYRVIYCTIKIMISTHTNKSRWKYLYENILTPLKNVNDFIPNSLPTVVIKKKPSNDLRILPRR